MKILPIWSRISVNILSAFYGFLANFGPLSINIIFLQFSHIKRFMKSSQCFKWTFFVQNSKLQVLSPWNHEMANKEGFLKSLLSFHLKRCRFSIHLNPLVRRAANRSLLVTNSIWSGLLLEKAFTSPLTPFILKAKLTCT